MARFYSNENFPLPTVKALRKLGHDILTTEEAGNANQQIPDDEVLRYAIEKERAILTINHSYDTRRRRSRKRKAPALAIRPYVEGSGTAPNWLLWLITAQAVLFVVSTP